MQEDGGVVIYFAVAVLVYFAIGFGFAMWDMRAGGKFHLDNVFLWIIGLDIRLRGWLKVRRIKRGEK